MDSIFCSPSLMDQLVYDIPTSTNSQREDEFEGLRERTDGAINKHSNNLCQGTRNKKIYHSPQWRRDSTNRLQRKSIRKSLSLESAIDQIGESDSEVTDVDDIIWNTNNINDRTPRWQRVEYECSMKLRQDLIPIKKHNVFNSTMNNGYSRKAVPESNKNTAPLFDSNKENSPANNERNRTRKFKVGNSLMDWSPFWGRNNDSRRLERRHYVTDFFDSMEQ